MPKANTFNRGHVSVSARWGCLAAGVVLILAGRLDADPPVIRFNDDGGWCWFQDERALVHGGKLVIGSVASGFVDPSRKGNIEVVVYDPATGGCDRSVLHERLQRDDHAAPAFVVRRDGRLLAMYCRHGNDARIYSRVSERPGVAGAWRPEQAFVPSERSRVTYSNVIRLGAEGGGRLFNFFRGYDDSFKPSWMSSVDGGQTWTAHGLWIDFPARARHRPYVKYTSNGTDTLHFAFTEAHPRDFDNSVYHAYYRGGAFYRSDGTKIKRVADGPVTPAEATRVFAGDADHVAWVSDVELDQAGRPVIVYSVQVSAAGQGRAHPDAGQDHRYRYARWDGQRWRDHEVAHAGTRLYAGEDDYTGLICIDPDRPNVVYLSSDVDLQTRAPNASGHYEVHRGRTDDFGRTWSWTAITHDSTADNLRPIVPRWDAQHTAVLWLRGTYRSYTDYELEVVGIIEERAR